MKLSYADAPPPCPEQTLPSIIGQINNRIAQILERQEIAGQAIYRLVNPRPVPVNHAPENAKIGRDTIEDRMEEIIRALDAVLARAREQSDTLNAAV